MSGSDKIQPELDAHSQIIIEVRTLMKVREEARKSNNFGKSDAIREKLSTLGVIIKDQVGGPSGWKFEDGRSNKLPAGVKQNAIPVSAQKIRDKTVVAGKRVRDEDNGDNDKKNKKNKKDGAKDSKDVKKDVEADKPATKAAQPKPAKAQTVQSETPEQQRNKAFLAKSLDTGSSRNVNGVTIEEPVVGSGKTAENGKKIKMAYVGRLKSNNKVFDASGQKPFVFKLGRSEVIKGWDIGCLGMKVGGKRRLTIPPEKGYGRSGAPPTIPPNATLVFDVTLLDVM